MGLPSHNVRTPGQPLGPYRPSPSLAKPNSAGVYVRHRPETTLLYQVVQEYWPEFQAELASHGRYLPAYVTKEFDEYLKCGRLEHGFLRVRCDSCHDEKLVAFSWPLMRIPAPAALVNPFTSPQRGFRLKAPTLGVPVAAREE